LTEKRSGAAAARRCGTTILVVAVVSLVSSRASAEKTLADVDGWQVYSDGRAGGFVSWAYGDGYPQTTYGVDVNGNPVPLQNPIGGGFRAVSQQGLNMDPTLNIPPGTVIPDQGTINIRRFRSGFVSNVFGFGVRGPLTAYTTVSAYVQIWAFIENDGRQKNLPNIPDARQGYAKLEGPWGSVTAGRVRGLF